MMQVLLVALGGAVGSVARYGVGYFAARTLGVGFPWGTLLVNILGGLAMGVLTAKLDPSHEDLRLLIGVGVLGGFTTFSTFSIESVHLLERNLGLGALYVVASVVLSVAACWAGFALSRA
ncbi:MAG TPA: fluoride efflux transporter CrcB [Vitreimonas sp.]|jgi:CrcB protein|nr:fluoride efflux transporter CrcB [Vitreimonas sp.]